MTYQMLPSYRHKPADLAYWRFREGYGAMPHRCLPPADVMFVLAASQRTPQEYAGVTVIQRHSGGSGPHDALQRVKYPHLPRPRHPQTYTTSAWPLPLIAFGQEVNIDQDNQQEQPINLSLARSLYATPELDLVPVRMRSCDPVRPNVTWQAVTIITAAGAALELHRTPNSRDIEFALQGDAPAGWETGCRQITATLAVTDAYGASHQALLPMGAFLSGDIEDEKIWLTADWTTDRKDELKGFAVSGLLARTGRSGTHHGVPVSEAHRRHGRQPVGDRSRSADPGAEAAGRRFLAAVLDFRAVYRVRSASPAQLDLATAPR